jgi:hypothetical protein
MRVYFTPIWNTVIAAAWFAPSLVAVAVLVAGLAGPVGADLDAGLDAWERGDYATAHQEWRSLAEQGDSDAQYNLGTWYYHVEKNYANAAKWWRESAQQGHPLAQHDLGSLYVLAERCRSRRVVPARWRARTPYGAV